MHNQQYNMRVGAKSGIPQDVNFKHNNRHHVGKICWILKTNLVWKLRILPSLATKYIMGNMIIGQWICLVGPFSWQTHVDTVHIYIYIFIT